MEKFLTTLGKIIKIPSTMDSFQIVMALIIGSVIVGLVFLVNDILRTFGLLNLLKVLVPGVIIFYISCAIVKRFF